MQVVKILDFLKNIDCFIPEFSWFRPTVWSQRTTSFSFSSH